MKSYALHVIPDLWNHQRHHDLRCDLAFSTPTFKAQNQSRRLFRLSQHSRDILRPGVQLHLKVFTYRIRNLPDLLPLPTYRVVAIGRRGGFHDPRASAVVVVGPVTYDSALVKECWEMFVKHNHENPVFIIPNPKTLF